MDTKNISKILKNKGLRITKARSAILARLSKTSQPQDAESIQKSFKRRTNPPHLTTIYRELHTLEKNNLIQSCQIFGKKEYLIKNSKQLAHCIKCNNAISLSPDTITQLHKTKSSLFQSNGFTILTPDPHLHGVCLKCNKGLDNN